MPTKKKWFYELQDQAGREIKEKFGTEWSTCLWQAITPKVVTECFAVGNPVKTVFVIYYNHPTRNVYYITTEIN